MTARAHIERDWQMDGLRIGIRQQSEDGTRVVTMFPAFPLRQVIPAGMAFRDVDEDGSVPYLSLNDDEARAVYEALADYFGNATNDVRLLRRDYDAERARVDRFIDVLVRPAAILQAPRGQS